ncbi:protein STRICTOSIDINE SYNTHASE-LIKE 5 isoform X1 [Selaginella moellendorffii]|uniref:protein STRICTOSIDINE SYNTHASE-LIKE 5 isoform X1 n=1 Tax=Selaginella moellendorffii TaxID=88036 RepID=UPI000D1CE361|nr:protein STRICTOSIDINE SYNTHASE-LIKE 5 isoform X1 [Selaginella moellendorffii]|eukprot:XP_024518195.1 protein STRICTOSIDINE SYNTHASE-LIKE 5 isoform X1 [Selaginella moellendorffii]
MAAALATVAMVALSIAVAALYSRILSTSRLADPLPLNFPRPPSIHDFPEARDEMERMERIGEGLIPGAEDFAVDQDERYLYAACSDGWIRQIDLVDHSVKNWSYVGGRPLGIAAGLSKDEMLVCEPQMGLLSVTENGVRVLSGQADGLSYKSVKLLSLPLIDLLLFCSSRLADGLDVARDGTVYFTDASTSYGLHDFDLDLLEGRPYGRLLEYSPRTNQTTVLLRSLFFPNGVALSENEDFLVFCETSQARLQRYWLRGDKAGTAEVYVDNLPGLPDNVHRFGNHFWIALLGGRSFLWEQALKFPLVKHILGSQRLLLHYLHTSYSRVLTVDEDGKPLDMYESLQSESIGFMTTGMRVGNFLYLGSLSANYIGRIPVQE